MGPFPSPPPRQELLTPCQAQAPMPGAANGLFRQSPFVVKLFVDLSWGWGGEASQVGWGALLGMLELLVGWGWMPRWREFNWELQELGSSKGKPRVGTVSPPANPSLDQTEVGSLALLAVLRGPSGSLLHSAGGKPCPILAQPKVILLTY